ncbi:hypothetical protein ACNR9Q_10245 [Maribacter sp. X9]|uniref:hypothetical protein n=1 Tax=Maribacter sp. X9 TaxID=3402159 RepID=UPI003AF3B0D6
MNIQSWRQQVICYNSVLNDRLKLNIAAKELYYGFDVIDGKLLSNPDILIIGANPGKGNENDHYKVKFSTDRISYLDIYNQDYKNDYKNGYHLAEKTLRLFELAGWSDHKIIALLENRAVKTNFYHIITDNINTINF